MNDRQEAASSTLTLRQHLLLVLVLLVALGLRGGYLWGQARNNPMFARPVMDAGFHHEWAQRIAAGEGLEERPYFRAPLYYYLLAGIYKLFGPHVLAGRIAGCILGALSCYLLAWLGVALAGFRAGLLAGLIAAFYWPFIYFDAELLTVGLEVFLNVALLIVLLRAARRDSRPLFLAAGIIWGLSAITRPNVLAFAVGIFAWLWIAYRPGRRLYRAAQAAALTCIGAALIVLPVTIRNYVVGGELVLIATNGGVNFYIGNNPEADGFSAIVPGTRRSWEGGFEDTHRIAEQEMGRPLGEKEVSDYWYARAFEWIGAQPGAWARLMLRKLRVFCSPIEMPNNQPIWFFAGMAELSTIFWLGFPVVACLGVAALLLVGRQWREWALPLAFAIIYGLTVLAFFCPGRYRLPIVPVLIVLAAAGLVELVRRLKRREFDALRVYVVAGALTGVLLYLSAPNLAAFQELGTSTGHYALAVHFAEPEPGRRPDYTRAVEHFRASLRLTPSNPEALCSLAWLLSTAPRAELRDGVEALRLVRQAEELVQAGWPPVNTLKPLAAAYAELGRYDEAVEVARRALRQAKAVGADTARLASWLRLYEQRKPLHLGEP